MIIVTFTQKGAANIRQTANSLEDSFLPGKARLKYFSEQPGQKVFVLESSSVDAKLELKIWRLKIWGAVLRKTSTPQDPHSWRILRNFPKKNGQGFLSVFGTFVEHFYYCVQSKIV